MEHDDGTVINASVIYGLLPSAEYSLGPGC